MTHYGKGLGAGFLRSGLRRAGHVVAPGPVAFARGNLAIWLGIGPLWWKALGLW